MQFAASAQGLSGPPAAALAGVVDEEHGGFRAALDGAQEAEDGGDLPGGVLVDAVEADQRIEDEEPGPDALHGLQEAGAVLAMVEAQDGDVDDGDVEGVEGSAGGPADTLQPGPHDVACILGTEQQDGSFEGGGEVAEAGDAGGDGDGEIESEEGLAALGLAADDADTLFAPQGVDEPLLAAGTLLEFGRGACREAVHGCSSSRAFCRCSAVTVLALSRAAADSA